MVTEHADALSGVVKRTVNFMFPVEARLVERRPEFAREAPYEVSGIIGIHGSVQGTIVMSFPEQLARRVTAWMLAEEDPASCSDEEVADCIGEIANIVAGNMLPLVSDPSADWERISLPTVVMGPHRVLWGSKDIPCDFLLFETDLGEFAAEINLRDDRATDDRDGGR